MSNSRAYILAPNLTSVLNNTLIGIMAQNVHCVFPPKPTWIIFVSGPKRDILRYLNRLLEHKRS